MVPNVDQDRDFAIKTKPQFHRSGLSFRCEGFWFKANKTSPVRETDYSANNWATTLTQEEASGQNQLHVASVKNFARFMPITIGRDGPNEEVLYITAIDVANKVLTLSENLANTHSSGASVDMDRVFVSESGGVTTIDMVICGQNSNPAIAGADVQFASARVDEAIGWENIETLNATVRVPYSVGASVLGGTMCENVYICHGHDMLENNSGESATALDPNYVLRVTFKGGGAKTEKHVSIKLGIWRV